MAESRSLPLLAVRYVSCRASRTYAVCDGTRRSAPRFGVACNEVNTFCMFKWNPQSSEYTLSTFLSTFDLFVLEFEYY
jgi:hypothetical protein